MGKTLLILNLQRKAEGRGQRAEGKIIKNPLGVGLKPTKIIKMYFEESAARNTASKLQSHVFKRGFLQHSCLQHSCLLNRLVANNPNVLFVIAAGNEGNLGISGLDYPATLAGSYSNVVAVGASWGTTDPDGIARTPGERIQYNNWWGSNYGQGLTLMGPSEVVTTEATRLPTGAVQFDFYPGSGARFNGTSAATPNVTGVASLVWSADPNLSASKVKEILSQTAYDVGLPGYDTEYGSGFVNADAAVRRALAIARGAA